MTDVTPVHPGHAQAVATSTVTAWPRRLTVDLEHGVVEVDTGEGLRTLPLADPEAFSLVSGAWLRAGWDAKHVYSFSWMGRPVIQLPEDLVRMQECSIGSSPMSLSKPVSPTAVHSCSTPASARRGAAAVSSEIDIEIRPHNRAAIESHELFRFITMIEGSSIAPDMLRRSPRS